MIVMIVAGLLSAGAPDSTMLLSPSDDMGKKICRRERPKTGSRVARRLACLTKAQWVEVFERRAASNDLVYWQQRIFTYAADPPVH